MKYGPTCGEKLPFYASCSTVGKCVQVLNSDIRHALARLCMLMTARAQQHRVYAWTNQRTQPNHRQSSGICPLRELNISLFSPFFLLDSLSLSPPFPSSPGKKKSPIEKSSLSYFFTLLPSLSTSLFLLPVRKSTETECVE